jgi:hypothetical protein
VERLAVGQARLVLLDRFSFDCRPRQLLHIPKLESPGAIGKVLQATLTELKVRWDGHGRSCNEGRNAKNEKAKVTIQPAS